MGIRGRGEPWTELDRQAMWSDLLPEGPALRRFVWRFGILSVLSTVLASFGLISNSLATLIAGMLVDPLMTPILAAAAAMVSGEPTRLVRAVLFLVGGTVLAIGTGWVIAAISPGFASVRDLTPELLLRTSPSLLDLGVAVAAGVSAGYVLTHREASSALPGVAVAVALVPPLAAIGVLANVGAGAEARGAFLLYLTNLGAIIVSAMALLFTSGFVTRDRSPVSRPPVRAGFAITLLVLLAVAVPLTRQTFAVVAERNFHQAVLEVIEEWDPNSGSVDLTAELDGERGDVSLTVTTTEAVPAADLARLVHERTGRPVRVYVEYSLDTRESATAG